MKKILLYVVLSVSCFFGYSNIVMANENVNSTMSQSEIDEVMTKGGDINILPGDYQFKIIRSIVDDTKIMLGNSDGARADYTSLRIINEADTNISLSSDVLMNGNFVNTMNGLPAGIFVKNGNTLVNANAYTLTITNYAGGIRLGENSSVISRKSASLTISSGEVIIKDSVATGERNDDGNPVGGAATGGGIFIDSETDNIKYAFKVENSKLTIKDMLNGIGIYRLNFYSSNQSLTDGSSTIVFDNADVTITNTKSGYSAFVDEGYNSDNVTLLINKSILNLNNNAKNGYTGADSRRQIRVVDSVITANDNVSAGMKFDCQKIDIINSKLYAEGNGSFGFTGMTNANVSNSIIETNNNRLAGMVFSGNSIVTNNSKLLSNKDGERTYSTSRSSATAVRIYPGTLTVENSITNFDSVSGISFYNNNSGNVRLYIKEGTVAVITSNEDFNTSDGELYDDFNNLKQNTGRTIVIGGSLQAYIENMSMSETLKNLKNNILNPVIAFSNGEKEDTQYLAPVNTDGTALTRFDLNSEVNKEVGGEGSHTFVYYDPNIGTKYTYTFRYNELGEDLIEGESNNAYVWTPVSEINYDATEGEVVIENSTATLVGDDSRYATDITIFGNSLDLAEKLMPTAYRKGYKFLGWYISINDNEVDQINTLDFANNTDFASLYDILNYKFEQNSKIVSTLNQNETGIESITVYAKWAKETSVIVHYVDIKGETLANDEVISGYVDEEYSTIAKEIDNYYLTETPTNAKGIFDEDTIHVTYVYDENGIGTDEPPYTGVEESSNNLFNVILLVMIMFIKKVFIKL